MLKLSQIQSVSTSSSTVSDSVEDEFYVTSLLQGELIDEQDYLLWQQEMNIRRILHYRILAPEEYQRLEDHLFEIGSRRTELSYRFDFSAGF